MRAGVVVIALLGLSAGSARADDERVQLGVEFMVAAETTSMESGGLPGIGLELVYWQDRLGLVLEAAHVRDFDSDGGSWVGAGLRAAFVRAERDVGPHTMGLDGWLQVGATREVWQLRDDTGSVARNCVHVGVGFTALAGRRGRSQFGGLDMWFRMMKRDADGMEFDDVPARTNMMFGTGFLF